MLQSRFFRFSFLILCFLYFMKLPKNSVVHFHTFCRVRSRACEHSEPLGMARPWPYAARANCFSFLNTTAESTSFVAGLGTRLRVSLRHRLSVILSIVARSWIK